MWLWGGSVFLFPVFASLRRESSPPWQGLEPLCPRPLCLVVNGAFFTKPTERQNWFTTNDHKWKEQPCLECAPSSTSLRSPLSGGLCLNVTQGIKVNKTLNISLDVDFFLYTLCLVKCETSVEGPQDLLADWQHKHSCKAARMVYFFWALECSLKRDKDGSAHWLPSKWHFAA